MKNELDGIKTLWQQAKSSSQEQAAKQDASALIGLGEAKKKSALVSHYSTIAILSATLVILIVYFFYLFSFKALLSNVGIFLMVGGMSARIAIEVFSIIRSLKIRISDITAESIKNSIAFHQFRKRIHGPVTRWIFGLYFVGFYMLTPEFLQHIQLPWVIAIDVSAILIALVLIKVIRTGIRQELKDLEAMVSLQEGLTKEN
jgi:hypothetical protein